MGWRGPMTHRQFLAWRDWMQDEWNRPNRSDHYQMQTALEVRRAFTDGNNTVQLGDMKVGFEHRRPTSKRQQQKQTLEEDQRRVAASKSMWRGILKPEVRYKDKP